MLQFLHRYSAAAFYILTGSLFGAYLLYQNGILGIWPRLWMDIVDLPTALMACLFGGISLYRSVAPEDRRPVLLPWVIGLPLVTLFGFLLVLNFGFPGNF